MAEIDEWQTEMQLKPMRVGTLHLFSEMLTDVEQALTGVQQVTSLRETLETCVRLGGDKQVAVIPDGPYTIPVIGG